MFLRRREVQEVRGSFRRVSMTNAAQLRTPEQIQKSCLPAF